MKIVFYNVNIKIMEDVPMQFIAKDRVTNLSSDGIIKRLEQREDFTLLNEAGIIFLSTENEEIRRGTENVLTKALWSEDRGMQFIGYCQLRRANGTASDKAHDEINLFQMVHTEIAKYAANVYWL